MSSFEIGIVILTSSTNFNANKNILLTEEPSKLQPINKDLPELPTKLHNKRLQLSFKIILILNLNVC